jgi:hypothetical protein
MITGCVMTHPSGTTDVHFKSLVYRAKYLERFVYKSPQKGWINKITGERFDHESEVMDNLFANYKELVESYYPALGFYDDPRLLQN